MENDFGSNAFLYYPMQKMRFISVGYVQKKQFEQEKNGKMPCRKNSFPSLFLIKTVSGHQEKIRSRQIFSEKNRQVGEKSTVQKKRFLFATGMQKKQFYDKIAETKIRIRHLWGTGKSKKSIPY